PKVDKDHRVATLNTGVGTIDHHRFDELIGRTRFVRLLNSTEWMSAARGVAMHERVPGALCPFPAFVTIHCVVATTHRSDADICLLSVFCTECRHELVP